MYHASEIEGEKNNTIETQTNRNTIILLNAFTILLGYRDAIFNRYFFEKNS
jgi:hypothetical protein